MSNPKKTKSNIKNIKKTDTLPAIFESFKIRRIYDEEKEKWYFSVIDIVSALTEQYDFKKAQSYWTTLKNRLKNEGSEIVTKCDKLKLLSADGKKYFTDVADTEILLRLIQSIPSPKAEPIKLWLAKVGYERIQEMNNPELALNRSREYWQKYGHDEKWIQQRMMGQEVRNKLTDYWKGAGIKNKNESIAGHDEFAILTNIIHKEWAEIDIKEHKKLKGLKTQNLRDHMSEAELVFTALAELSTRQIAENIKAKGLEENKNTAIKGGRIAKDAKLALEEKTGKKVVTSKNYLDNKKQLTKNIKQLKNKSIENL